MIVFLFTAAVDGNADYAEDFFLKVGTVMPITSLCTISEPYILRHNISS